jgi:hypothetical protein
MQSLNEENEITLLVGEINSAENSAYFIYLFTYSDESYTTINFSSSIFRYHYKKLNLETTVNFERPWKRSLKGYF